MNILTSAPTIEALESVDQIEHWLKQLCHTASGPYLRPFAPNPNWKQARVFIVGTNPATPLRDEFSSFSHYWDALTCDKAAFDAIYLPKRDGKASRTSERATRFEQALGKLSVLRTNACALPSGRWGDLPGATRRQFLEQGREVLDALVKICRPRVILCHGKPAVEVVSSLTSTSLDPYEPLAKQNNVVTLAHSSLKARVFAYPHLSGIGVKKGFAVSKMDDDLMELAQRLNRELT